MAKALSKGSTWWDASNSMAITFCYNDATWTQGLQLTSKSGGQALPNLKHKKDKCWQKQVYIANQKGSSVIEGLFQEQIMRRVESQTPGMCLKERTWKDPLHRHLPPLWFDHASIGSSRHLALCHVIYVSDRKMSPDSTSCWRYRRPTFGDDSGWQWYASPPENSIQLDDQLDDTRFVTNTWQRWPWSSTPQGNLSWRLIASLEVASNL